MQSGHVFINMHFLCILMAFFIYKALYINENYSVPNPGQDNHDAVVLESIQDTYVVCH